MTKAAPLRWRRLALLLGIAGGLALAIFGALNDPEKTGPLPPGAIAKVGTSTILHADFARALTAVSAGKRNLITQSDEAIILDRLIDQELLIQHALQLGMVEADIELRNALANALTREVITRSRTRSIREADLQSFYQQNQQLFARQPRYHLRAVLLTTPSEIDDFAQAIILGKTPEQLVQHFGQNTVPIPNGLLPRQKLLEYVGATIVGALDGMGTGQWSKPIDTKAGVWRIYLHNRLDGQVWPLDTIRSQVENAYKDHRDDLALRRYLDQLRQKTDITIRADWQE